MPWQLTEVRGHLPDLAFSLIDDNNQPVTAQTYRGKIILLYFGFTGCSAQCPLTLSRLVRLLNGLGTAEAQVRVLFVTIDPTHDTPQEMQRYVAQFDAIHMAGLTGSESAIGALAKHYRTLYQPYASEPNPAHSNTIYIFDAQGRARLLATADDGDEAIAHDVRQLADETGR